MFFLLDLDPPFFQFFFGLLATNATRQILGESFCLQGKPEQRPHLSLNILGLNSQC